MITNYYFLNQQCSPDQVHAQQSLSRGDGLSGPDGLISDTDSLVVGSHFSPPHPGGLAKDDGMSLFHLRDLNVRALQKETSKCRRSHHEGELLRVLVLHMQMSSDF